MFLNAIMQTCLAMTSNIHDILLHVTASHTVPAACSLHWKALGLVPTVAGRQGGLSAYPSSAHLLLPLRALTRA